MIVSEAVESRAVACLAGFVGDCRQIVITALVLAVAG